MRFKTWLISNESVIGPGGSVDDQPTDLEDLSGNIAKHGAGAFPQAGDDPPKLRKTAATNYADSRFSKRPPLLFKKKMKKI